MLVLTRRIGERIAIGDDTFLMVRSISGRRVRLAVEAPRHTPVLRGELTIDDRIRGSDERVASDSAAPTEALAPPLRAYLPSKRVKHG
ncbi:MAG: carbon storage regulator [Pirellulales bacterium]